MKETQVRPSSMSAATGKHRNKIMGIALSSFIAKMTGGHVRAGEGLRVVPSIFASVSA